MAVQDSIDELIRRLASNQRSEVLDFACPVPFFGRLPQATVATVGINPSDVEFVDRHRSELVGKDIRLATLSSLGLDSWDEADSRSAEAVTLACENYFSKRPYGTWFDQLEKILQAGGASYYDSADTHRATHLDLVAFATSPKWSKLPGSVARELIAEGSSVLAQLVRDSSLQVLVLNGAAVTREFERSAGVPLATSEVEDWTLHRAGGPGVKGRLYRGVITIMSGIELGRDVQVVGWNHNLQSGFGVRNEVRQSIAERVGQVIRDAVGGPAA